MVLASVHLAWLGMEPMNIAQRLRRKTLAVLEAALMEEQQLQRQEQPQRPRHTNTVAPLSVQLYRLRACISARGAVARTHNDAFGSVSEARTTAVWEEK